MSEAIKGRSRIALSPGALLAPLPAVLVTCACPDGGGGVLRDVVTVAWTGMLCTRPPMTYVSLRPQRYSHGIISRSGEFVINLPTADMTKKLDLCGMLTGAKADKFKRCGFETISSAAVAAPTIADCPLSLECRLRKPDGVDLNPLPLGSHDLFFAEIVSVTADSRLMSESGALRLDKAGLVGYLHGEYYAMGRYAGKFGFSVKKKQNTNL